MNAGGWLPIKSAPRDGTWLLGCNDAGHVAVIIWSTNALRRRRYPLDGRFMEIREQCDVGEGWIFPFSTGEVSAFWETARVIYWQPLPPGMLKE